jgi:hypothetical protein
MICLLEAVLKEGCPANPSKIVAGLDAEQTNIMLQQLHKAATMSLPEAVNNKLCQQICANANSGQPLDKGLQMDEEKDKKGKEKEKLREREQREKEEREREEREREEFEKERERKKPSKRP